MVDGEVATVEVVEVEDSDKVAGVVSPLPSGVRTGTGRNVEMLERGRKETPEQEGRAREEGPAAVADEPSGGQQMADG